VIKVGNISVKLYFAIAMLSHVSHSFYLQQQVASSEIQIDSKANQQQCWLTLLVSELLPFDFEEAKIQGRCILVGCPIY